MGQTAATDLIADFLLRYYREPMRYRAQAPRAIRLYGNLDAVLRLALGRAVFSDPALRVPAIAAELERAAVFYIQQQFFRDDATHYEVLGLANDASAKAVRENFRLLMQLIHPDRQGADTIWPESYAARANRAHALLKSSRSRTDYDRQLTAAHARETSSNPTTIVAGTRGPARVVPSPRRSAPVSVLPEWWKAGVGGFVREHPRFTAFAVLVSVSVLAVVMVMDSEREGVLTADIPAYTTPLPPKKLPVERAPVIARGSPADGTSTVAMNSGAHEGAAAAEEIPVARADEIASARAVEPQVPQSGSVQRTPQPARAAEAAAAAVAAPAAVRAMVPSVTVAPARSTPPGAPGSVAAMPAQAPVPASPQAPAPALAQSQPATAPSAIVQTATSPAALVPAASAAVPPPAERTVAAIGPPPGSAEVEVLIAAFVSSYEKGRLDTFAKLFDDDAQANEQRGRAAIASEYDQLFRSTVWRHIAIFQLGWKPVGDHTEAKGEFLVKTGWRDGREVEQRVAVDMELVRQGGRAVIAKLSFQPR